MALPTRARIAGILAIGLLMLGAPGALAGSPIEVDAQIRLGSGSYVGDGIYNTTAVSQSVSNFGTVGQKLTFFILIENDSVSEHDPFRVKRSGFFHNGYRVRYYDAANNDVTGQVNNGTFSTPLLAPGEVYEVRATVKVRPQATACSSVTRLVTVSSFSNPDIKDAVRFSAALAPGCPKLTVRPGVLSAPNFYDFDFGSVPDGATQIFTLKNEGTGPSDELGFSISGFGFAWLTGNCTGATLTPGGACTFWVVAPSCPETTLLQTFGVTGGVPPTLQYLTLAVSAHCD